jgi:hypothetical protein
MHRIEKGRVRLVGIFWGCSNNESGVCSWNKMEHPLGPLDWEGSFFSAMMISVCLALSTALSFEKSIPKIDKQAFCGLVSINL